MKVKVTTSGQEHHPENQRTPGLALYIPALRRVIRLNRQQISFGSSKFRDLDLSAIPDSRSVPEYEGEFLFREDDWMLQPKEKAACIRLNGQPLNMSGEAVRLQRGDRIELGDGFRMSVRGCEKPGITTGPELGHDFVLMFQSVSMNNGHLGIQIRYDAARRMLVREDWGVVGGKQLNDPPEERPVPEEITTREEVYEFANRRGWEYCPMPERMYDQDVMLWLGQEAQVQYVAEKGEVLYRKWVHAEDSADPVLQEHWCRFVRTCPSEEKIREYVRRTWPHFPHNRKGELDSDMNLSMPADEKQLFFRAETREVICKVSKMQALWGEKEQSVRIPDPVTTKNELDWYLKIHKPDWMPPYVRWDDMLRDAVISAGSRPKGLKLIRWETRYRAEDRTVTHVADVSSPETTTSEPLKVPFDVFAMQFLPEFVKKHRPEWMK